ncbi:hypothetical protein Hanom_Chr10g00901331 [Helianthus anomalus]
MLFVDHSKLFLTEVRNSSKNHRCNHLPIYLRYGPLPLELVNCIRQFLNCLLQF